MKYIRTYLEKLNREPQIDDYVVVKFFNNEQTPEIQKELEKTIGKIEGVYSNSYHIRFGTVTFNINKENIFDFSDRKEDLGYYINAKQYNL